MNKFDKSVNILLENLIFEQDQSEIDPDQIIKQTISEIEKRDDEDRKAYMNESKAKYMASQGFVEEVEKYVSGLSEEQLSEETGLEKAWGAAKEAGSAAWDWAKKTLGPSLSEIGDAAADKIGEYATDFIGKEYVDDINNNLSETVWYKIAAIFEPTGVMSWPYYREALDLYEKHKGTEDEDIYFLNLLAAQISVIPGVRVPLGILTAPFKLIFLPLTIPRRIAAYVAKAIKEHKAAQQAISKLPILQRFFKTTTRILKPVVKTIPPAAKVGTVVSSGDIPQTWKDWSEAGKKSLEDAKPRERTLGKFPSFNHLSTQRF